MEKNEIFIITGTRGSGKTLFINDVYDFLRIFENNISGFVSKGVFNEEGQKEFRLKILNSDQELHLASRHERPGYNKSGKFFFNPQAIEMGNRVIDRALEQNTSILIIDEIGPVELEDQVWHEAFKKTIDGFRGILIFSTRKRMVERIIEKYNIKGATIADIEESSPRKIGEAVMSIVLNLQRNGKGQLSV